MEHPSRFSSLQHEEELRNVWGSSRSGFVRDPASSLGQRHLDVQIVHDSPPRRDQGSYFPMQSLEEEGERARMMPVLTSNQGFFVF